MQLPPTFSPPSTPEDLPFESSKMDLEVKSLKGEGSTEATSAQKAVEAPNLTHPDSGEATTDIQRGGHSPRDAPRDARRPVPNPGPKFFLLVLMLTKKVLTSFFTVFFIAIAAIYIWAALNSTIPAQSPICQMPVFSVIVAPICRTHVTMTRNVNYSDLMELQEGFEKVLDSSAGTSSMASEIRDAQRAVRDLSALIKITNLAAKDLLSYKLDEFVSSAKTTSRSLQRFGSRVGSAVDRILAVDHFILNSLEQIKHKEIEAATNILSLMTLPFREPIAVQREKIVQIFFDAAAQMHDNLKELADEASDNIELLDTLENQLQEIYEIVIVEDKEINRNEAEVLADMWARLLRANSRNLKLKEFESHRNLLKNIRSYRKRAQKRVQTTLTELERMSDDLEELRGRVASYLVAEDDGISLEGNIASLNKGIQRLAEARVKSKEVEAMTQTKKKEGFFSIVPSLDEERLF